MKLSTYLFIILFPTWLASQLPDNDQKLESYFDCGSRLLNQQIDSAIYCIDKAIELSDQLSKKDKLAEAFELKGLWYYKRSNYDSSILFYNLSFETYTSIDLEIKLSNLLASKALVLEKKGLPEEAIEYFQQSITLAEKYNDIDQIARSNSNIANLYMRLKVYNEAIKRYRKSLHYFSNSQNAELPDIAGTYLALGTCFKNLDKHDSANFYLRKSIKGFEQANIPLGIAFGYNNLGSLFEQQDMLDSAAYFYKKSISIKKEVGFLRGIPSSLKNLGSLLRKKGNLNQAQNYLLEGYNMVLSSKDSFLIRDFYLELAEVHSGLANGKKAIAFYQKFIELDNKISGEEKTAAISEVEEKYNKARNEQQIAELKLDTAKNLNERNQVLFGLGLLVLAIIFLISQRIQRKKARQILETKNGIITKALSEKEILLKEIHHRVKNNLQTISSLLNLQARYVDNEAKDAVMEGKNRVKSMALIHQKLYQSDNLKGISFSEYLEGLIDILFRSYSISQDRVLLKTDIDPLNLDIDTAIPIGLILNELISNSLKYAFPNEQRGEIEIKLKESNRNLQMTMIDSGIGMSPNFDLENSTSFGMKLIHTLAEKLDAEIKIDLQKGTRIHFEIRNYKLAS
ncbi:MAG: tetratricopeptide repeat protein [Ekhidna sp.]